jgi:hypothetical protein
MRGLHLHFPPSRYAVDLPSVASPVCGPICTASHLLQVTSSFPQPAIQQRCSAERHGTAALDALPDAAYSLVAAIQGERVLLLSVCLSVCLVVTSAAVQLG